MAYYNTMLDLTCYEGTGSASNILLYLEYHVSRRMSKVSGTVGTMN